MKNENWDGKVFRTFHESKPNWGVRAERERWSRRPGRSTTSKYCGLAMSEWLWPYKKVERSATFEHCGPAMSKD